MSVDVGGFSAFSVARQSLWYSSGEQRRDATYGHAAVGPFRSVGWDLQILLAIALRGEIFRRHRELLGQRDGNGLGTPIGQRQIVHVRADRVGVTFDQKDLARIVLNGAVEPFGNAG